MATEVRISTMWPFTGDFLHWCFSAKRFELTVSPLWPIVITLVSTRWVLLRQQHLVSPGKEKQCVKNAHLSVCLCLSLSVCQSVCLSMNYLPTYLSIHPSVCPSVYLSICLSFLWVEMLFVASSSSFRLTLMWSGKHIKSPGTASLSSRKAAFYVSV